MSNRDLEKALYICRALREGRKEVLEDFYKEWNPVLMKFATPRLGSPEEAEYVVSRFWKEFIEKRPICNYRKDRGASIGTFMMSILRNKIRDRVIEMERNRSRIVSLNSLISQGEEEQSYEKITMSIENRIRIEAGEKFNAFDSKREDPEHQLESIEKKEIRRKIFNEALERLSVIQPEDAKIVQLRLKGKGYKEISLILNKSENAVRQQFRRAKSRLKKVLERKLDEEGISLVDFVSDC